MKHLGDITLIKGYEAPVVDCVIGGSPCQDLSLAGKRAGLAGARSGLYMEQIRIIKEMREADVQRGKSDVDVRPRYMVWENVPGAFSTNGGKDFAAVIEEAIRVAEPEAPSVDVPKKGWPTSGCFFDEMGKWSVAWRVLDAQFWGTSDKPLPQRRRRIALVADFGGLSASEILFVRQSVSGDLEPGKPKRKETTPDTGEGSGGTKPIGFQGQAGAASSLSIGEDVASSLLANKECMVAYRTQENTGAVGCDLFNGRLSGDKAIALVTNSNATGIGATVISVDQGGGKSRANSYEDVSPPILSDSHGTPHAVAYGVTSKGNGDCFISEERHTALSAGGGQAGQGYPCVMEPVGINGNIAGTLDASYFKGCGERQGTEREVLCQPVGLEMQAFGKYKDSGIGSALKARDFKDATDLVVASVYCRNATEIPESNITLQSSSCHNLNSGNVVRVKHIVRRLTPLECERLQGFPDGWTDIGEWVDSNGKKHKEADSPRYKALGNSIALPPWKWVLKRLCACYERDATMASLFDGIGGFPYIWEQLNGKGSCLWASEIEEFPMAVTKLRFGGNDHENHVR